MADRVIELRVSGTPAPQGSKSAFVRGGRAVIVDGTSKPARQSLDAWRQAVATAGRDWQEAHDMPPALDGPVLLELFLFMVKPKSKPRWKWLPDTKPDIDKLLRSVLDALTGTVLTDDARIVAVVMFERYASDRGTGADIRLVELTEAERAGVLEVDGFRAVYTP